MSIKVAHCTQVHGIWPFWSLVLLFTSLGKKLCPAPLFVTELLHWKRLSLPSRINDILRDWILLVCFLWRYAATEGPRVNFVMREALFFRDLHVGPLSLHTSMRNKQVEFNPYIYILSKLYRFGCEISFFNTKHPFIILRASLFVVTPSHVAYGWPSYSQIIIFTSSKNIFTSSKNIFTCSRNKTLAKATHN